MEIHSPNRDEPFLNYAKTQRVVLLIDLNPLISLRNPPDRFISSLLCSAKSILSFPQLSSSLFAFRFFFSSLSPLFSSSKIQTLFPDSPISLSFDRPIPALESLARALESLASRNLGGDGSSENRYPSGSYFAAAMRQLVHDYAWDPLIDESTTGVPLNFDSVAVRSNLILLFSPVPSELKSLAKFLSVGIEDQCFANVCAFREKFRGLFANVNDAFSSRDIQLSWIDVRSEMTVELESGFEFFKSGIKNLGWGFCTTDSIVLGSALVPFGLIYPKIGISPNSFSFDDCSKKVQAQLCLEIVDVSQKPLECKCCNLELVDMKFHSRNGSGDSNINVPELANPRKIGIELKRKLLTCFGDGMSKYKVKALHKNNEFKKFKCNLSDPILVREVLLKPGKDHKKSRDGFFADKVLEMLTGSAPRKSSAPIWQILLTFLYRKGYCAITTISNSNGNSLTGILKPFTVSTGLLFLTDVDLSNFSTKVGGAISISAERFEKEGRKSMDKKNVKFLQDQTWDGFRAAAFESSGQELEEIYFSKRCSDQKRLRFLKCWMKQTKKSGYESTVLEEKSEPSQQEIQRDVEERLTESNQESEKPTSSASAGEYSLSAASRIQEAEACRVRDSEAVDLQLESPDDFFGSLSNKIQQGLESEMVNLGALAQRLVNASIYWLNRKQEIQKSESQMPEPKSQDSIGDSRGAELVRLLLRDPKDLTAKGKSSDMPSQESSAEKIVRGYELQILFRMEILQSEIGGSIGEPRKQKFVKQICLLLETIQCHLEGGFFGDWSLDYYVGKIIKARYSLTLDGIVNKIYKKMDLLLFAEEEELPVNIFNNSEDSNPPPSREKPDGNELDGFRSSERVSAEESLHSLETGESTHGEHARKLTEAKARRERARRFTSFTSWVPDLQRVWAPKQQPKPTKPKSDPHGKRPKKKKRAEETVCETPMSKNKRSLRYDSDDQHFGDDKSSCSVSKALFQDDW